MTFKLLIADDHPLFRAALKQTLQQSIDDPHWLEANTYSEVEELLEQNDDVDLLLLDLHMPGNKGLSSLVRLKASYPALPIVIVSAFDDAHIIKSAMTLGASGFIPKSAPFSVLTEAFQDVLDCKSWVPRTLIDENHSKTDPLEEISLKIASLTPQQKRVLAMIADGLLNKQIAFEMNVQETTIKQHVSAVLKKLEVINRTQAGIIFDRLAAASSIEDVEIVNHN